MSTYRIIVVTVVCLMVLLVSIADAKPMGGRKSFGRQSPNVTNQRAPATASPAVKSPAPASSATTSTATAAGKPASPWKGMLGGALLGLGLGALLSGMGVGAGAANLISMLLMVGIGLALVMVIMRLFKQKAAGGGSALRPAWAGATSATESAVISPEIGSRRMDYTDAPFMQSGIDQNKANDQWNATSISTWTIPLDMDVAQFERVAQTYFIRLQAAWDKGDRDDLREFMTPELFADVNLQLQERGQQVSYTDVLTVHAKLLGVETHELNYLASVKFTGTMKEDHDAPTISFDEVWNLSKPLSGEGGWLVAGIQQIVS